MKAIVTVLPKPTVLDPQGTMVARTLRHQGLNDIGPVRVGKLIEIELGSVDQTTLNDQLHQACRELLSNPVIEDYTFQIVK